ncbi:tyrosine-type recombinase/integrase [Pseudidiomarina terrestris]|uniref:tyrosine-type recombinase/integrase n=1 Tax=Pseudidiomarina terrestris TaxID=2820060 RepID=UPI002655CC8F|nr:tyrosine-type recombinase/integrase [Pseudidiomarina sp. 1ASP75-5]MDN7135225.1 site-specific integrase [Pseudidiomarina sp. 1ASP75-5]
MRPVKEKLTSITISSISKFLNQDGLDVQLGCSRINGFFLRKGKSGASWYFRYTDANGKRRKLKLGRLLTGDGQGGHIQSMASIALEYSHMLARGADPALHRFKLKSETRAAEEERLKGRVKKVGHFFEHIYKPHKMRSRYGYGTCQIIEANFSHLFHRNMNELSAEDIREWEGMRRKEKAELGKTISRETLVRDLGAFKAMLNYAAGRKKDDPIDYPVIETNPLDNVYVRKLSAEERDKRYLATNNNRRMLTPEELSSLIKGLDGYAEELRAKRRRSIKHGKPHLRDLDQVAYPHWFIPFAWVALYTGMRPGDIYGLRWEATSANAVNFNFNIVTAVPEKTRDKGDQPVSVKHPMSEGLRAVLKAWHEQQGQTEQGYVFPNGSGGRLAKKSHDKHWRHVKRIGELTSGLAFYSLRHHFISSLVMNRVPLLHIAKLVGHKSTHMIEQNYGHLLPDTAEAVIQSYSQSICKVSNNVPGAKEVKHR